MMFLAAIASPILFGGVPFGASEEEVRKTASAPLTEVTVSRESRALQREELIADRTARRRWVIRDNRFTEGVLIFDFKGEASECERLYRDALSALEGNYGVKPVAQPDTVGSLFKSERSIFTLPGQGRIEQMMVYAPPTQNCIVSGRYFAPVEGAAAF